MSAVVNTEPRAMDDRLRDAYIAARDAGHTSAYVAIHVGREVWEYLRALADVPTNLPPWARPSGVGTCWGYPLILDTSFSPQTIKVMTTVVIV